MTIPAGYGPSATILSFFTIQQDITIGETQVAIAGNRFLLHHPFKVMVQCSRSINTDEAIAHEVNRYMAMACDGAILVSPCISPCKKAVMRTAFEAGVREIILLENGFSPMWKPGGQQFDACARGQLLFVAPWPYHSEKKGSLATNACNSTTWQRPSPPFRPSRAPHHTAPLQ